MQGRHLMSYKIKTFSYHLSGGSEQTTWNIFKMVCGQADFPT